MIAVIRKASDWKFERVEKHFTLDKVTLEALAKEFDHHTFVVDIKPWEEEYDVEIIVYDDYLEQTAKVYFHLRPGAFLYGF